MAQLTTESILAELPVWRHALTLGLVDKPAFLNWMQQHQHVLSNSAEMRQLVAQSERLANPALLALMAKVPVDSAEQSWWPALKHCAFQALQEGRVEAQTLTSYLYNLALEDEVPAYDKQDLYQLELEFDSLLQGFASEDEVTQQMLSFLQRGAP